MGLQKKLDRAMREGVVFGTKSTFEVWEKALTNTPGVGPKTREKVLLAVHKELLSLKLKEDKHGFKVISN